MKQRAQSVIGVLLGLMVMVGCSKNGSTPIQSIVNQVKLNTFYLEADQWIELKAKFETGGFSLAGINVPVINPENPTQKYGELTLVPTFCTQKPCTGSGGELMVRINLTESTRIQGNSNPELPNHTPLPVGGLDETHLVVLPIPGSGARIYLAFGRDVAVFGVALPFGALDPAGKYLPGVNIFEPLEFDGVRLIAGIFAGAEVESTGIGVFVDLSDLLPASGVSIRSAVILDPVKPSLATERAMYFKLYSLSQKGLTLDLKSDKSRE